MKLFWRILITAACLALGSALLIMCSLPADAQSSDPMPTMLSTSWTMGTPTLSPWPPLPTATSTPEATQQTTVYLPLIQHSIEDVRPDDMVIWLVSWLPMVGGAG